MELDVVRMVAAALMHPTWGVNVALPAVPRDVGDDAPPAVTVYDSTRHGWIARREISLKSIDAQLPALAVAIYKPAPIDGEIQTVFRDGTFDVLIEYFARADQSELASQQGLYTMRAVLRTLAEFHRPANADARVRNGVVLRVCSQIGQAPVYAERADVVVTAALLATYRVRDTSPFVLALP